MPRYDLHAHSTHSDGLLAPSELVMRAAANGVDVLALTDHDDVSGIADARARAAEVGLTLIAGTELSVSWETQTLHIVGLNVDPECPTLLEAVNATRQGRSTRARRIADALAEAGIGGAYEGAMKYVKGERLVSRTHFARFLVEAGYANDVGDVFKRFLTRGNPGYVAHAWPSMQQAIDCIHAAGGQAVLAHPARYAVSPTALRRLLRMFRDAGGDAMEVVSGIQTAAETDHLAALARAHGLLGSCGSDFHAPSESRMDVGALPDIPPGVEPIWSRW